MAQASLKTTSQSTRVPSLDFLRGLVMVLMALDHVRMYFGFGTWYAEPTNLATTTALLFFTRWITHFCAPVFVFLTGTSAFLYGIKNREPKEIAWFLLTRGLWLVCAELVLVNFAWTFDITYSFRILQVIWAIGLSMITLSGLVFLPHTLIFAIGILLVFGHNLLDPIHVQGSSFPDMIWYTLHQPTSLFLNGARVNFVYPLLPWLGLMALGYTFGAFYRADFAAERRKPWLWWMGIGLTLLFVLLRGLNLYGEPRPWQPQESIVFTVMSFLNTTKYPPSLHFLLMTMGPALMFLSLVERWGKRFAKLIIAFGRVPFFFYVVHLYVIHALAMLFLLTQGRAAGEYILSAGEIQSGRLSNFGLSLEAVYLIWIAVVVMLYPLCRWYQKIREEHPSAWWLRYL
jgi:uncharacterized membrane protein